MTFIAGYLVFLLVFGVIDVIWLSVMAGRLYRPTLGEVLLDRIRWAPALLFYFAFPAGLIHFGLMSALQAGSAMAAFVNGGLLGLLAYGTYDLTNYATLRRWTLTITIADLVYGTVVAGISTLAAFAGVLTMRSWGWL
ncbi:MAG: DUF2177 family protein [Bosea sp. (in: a-proteobacteria)]|uniref:DUF2177 family protein n=1 Tax=Bosea sp. (in: a-proteobacteria) TaxID=1871050 RepID=UPI0027354593|nr:DUF2177 family protein [Bosea sp. (in: a-proteobacteria)]MDP3257802.1 DUF2177 family protein [Bosea sp. (in: a-proteobacteria)]MDP3321857.1 DUF2177 family protein [Bosea sp. (in: a-proteobacteria)]